MKSHAIGHFPQVRFSGGRKWLFNPVLKKRFANRPEERVRLQYVEFLLRHTTVRKNRVGFETPVKAESAENMLRADLVLYDRDMQPHALIECKSGRIKLNAKTAEQTARYNQSLQANYLMITNGIDDFWYRRDGQSVSPLKQHPFDLKETELDATKSPKFWTERGFLDLSLQNDIALPAAEFLNTIFIRPESATSTYLTLPPDISPASLDHFYRIDKRDKDRSLAFSLIAVSSNQTMLAAMLNEGGKNRGITWLPLVGFLKDGLTEAQLLSPEGTRTVHISEEAGTLLLHPSETNVKKLVNHLINLFY